jgi:PAS domain S-box-containing protein
LREQVMGYLILQSDQVKGFTETNLAWLSIIAQQISNVFHNARLYHDEMRQRSEAQTLRSITDLVTLTLDLDQLIEHLFAYLNNILEYDRVLLLLADDDYVEVVACWSITESKTVVGKRLKRTQPSVLDELDRRGEPMISAHASSDPLLAGWDIVERKEAWLGTPLIAQNATIGYLIIECDRADIYGSEDMRSIHTFANQCAMAIYNAQLYEEVRRYANELEERVSMRTAELQSANQALRRSETRYRTLFEATFEALCVHDRGILLDANPAFESMFGYDLAELKGMSIYELTTPESIATIRNNVQQQYEEPYTATVVRKNGKIIPVEILGKRYHYGGKEVRVTALRDITDRHNLERQRVELAVEKERAKLLSTFITQTSHEFRTPLTVIATKAYLMGKTTDSSKKQERIQAIADQVNYLAQLVESMVTQTQLDMQDAPETQIELDVNQIVSTAYQNEVDKLGVEDRPTTSLHLADEQISIDGDDVALTLAISNVINNALRYTSNDGNVRVAVGYNAEEVVITINDTGIGISDVHLPRIFERFYRVDVDGTTRGFGLGLSIARAVIVQHRGHIHVDSVEGQGTTARITIPLKQPEQS